MKVTDFIKDTYKPGAIFNLRPMIHCNDGFTISVQATKGHYCSPRIDTDSYGKVELGYPNREEPLLKQYAEQPDNLTDTVYGYVPIELVEKVIQLHGGIDVEQTFKKDE